MRTLVFAAFSMLCVAAGQSQTPHDGFVYNSKLNFKQQINIYQWSYNLDFQKRLSDKLKVTADAGIRTTLQSIASNDLWKDNQNATIRLNYKLSDNLVIQPSLHSYVLSDQLSGFDNDIELYSATARFVYQPHPRVTLTPEIGSKWQTQVKRNDQGLHFGLDAAVDDIAFGGYRSTLTVAGGEDVFPERRNEDLKLRYEISREFEPGTVDTLILVYDRLRKESFDADGSGVFIRNLSQTNQGIENHLSYAIASNTRLFLRNSFVVSTFEVNHLRDAVDDLRKDDTNFISEHSASLMVRKSRWVGHFSWNYRLRSRQDQRAEDTSPDPFGRHATLGFDTDDVLTGLRLNSGLALGQRDSLGINASVQKFRYETSDTTNPNDHDQLKWQLTLSHQHRFSPELNFRWRASAFLNHFVFISSRFSSGNNWERTFQLHPEITYRPSGGFGFRQGFIVRAKYQTFDFDNPATSNRNIVNRQFILTHSSYLNLTPRDRLELEFDLELAEQGRLFFDQWQQTLALSWRNHDIRVSWRHHFTPSFSIKPGASFFQQKRWNHRPDSDGNFGRSVRDTHTNFGPVLELTYYPRPSLEFRFFGNIQTVSSSRRRTDHINNFDLYLNWSF